MDIFKSFKIITKNNEIHLPQIIFHDSDLLKKYFEDFDELDLSDYDEKIIEKLLIILKSIYFYGDYQINDINEFKNLLILCDKFQLKKIYTNIYEKYYFCLYKYNIEYDLINNLKYDLINKEINKTGMIKLIDRIELKYINKNNFYFFFENNLYYIIYYFNILDSQNDKKNFMKIVKKCANNIKIYILYDYSENATKKSFDSIKSVKEYFEKILKNGDNFNLLYDNINIFNNFNIDKDLINLFILYIK